MTPEQFDHFIAQVKALSSIDFPDICDNMQLSWFSTVKPAILNNPVYLIRLKEVLERIKFSLYDSVLRAGRDGKKRNGRDPELTYINAIIRYIDSGALLADGEVIDSSGGANEEQLAKHKKRLGIENDKG